MGIVDGLNLLKLSSATPSIEIDLQPEKYLYLTCSLIT